MELRRSWKSWSVLALVCGIAAALPIAIAANARRTDTALPRLLTTHRAANAVVSADEARLGPDGADSFLSDVEALPGVIVGGRHDGLYLSRVMADGTIDPRLQTGSAVGKLLDERALDIGRFLVLNGRLPRDGRPDEVVASPEFLQATDLHVGDVVDDLRLYSLAAIGDTLEPDPTRGLPLSLRIVGEVRRPEDFLDAPGDRGPQLYFFPSFGLQHPDSSFYVNDYIRLAGGDRSVDQFVGAVNELSAKYSDEQPLVVANRDGLEAAQGALRPQLVASWLMSLVLAVVIIVIAAQAISRRLWDASQNLATLHALGSTRTGLFAVAMAQATTMAIAAAIVAPTIAFMTSIATPIGSSNAIEPDLGLRFDATALGLGALATAVILMGVATVPAWRMARIAAPGRLHRQQRGPVRPSRIVSALSNAGAGPAVLTGVRFAVQSSRDRSASPTRGVLLGVGLALGVLTAGIAFNSAIDRLLNVPRLHGWDWDIQVGNQFGSIPDEAVDAIRTLPEVHDVAGYTFGSIVIDGQEVPALGVDQLDGSVFPTLDDGRLPTGDGEIVLGALTMRGLHRSIGDSVEVATRSGSRTMTIVGQATFPSIGNVRFSGTGAGSGAAVAVADLPAPADDIGGRYSGVFVRLDPAMDRTTSIASVREFLIEAGCTDSNCVTTDSLPLTLKGYPRLNELTVPFTVVLESMFGIALAHGLLSSIAFRRRELWILSAIGTDRRQTSAIVVWQAIAIAVVALIGGLVIGLVCSRLAWRAFTHSFGIETAASTPFRHLWTMTATTFVLALVLAIAAVPIIRRNPTAQRHRLDPLAD